MRRMIFHLLLLLTTCLLIAHSRPVSHIDTFYPADGSKGVAPMLPYLWWDAPETEVQPENYTVTLSPNSDYSNPIIDSVKTADLMCPIPTGALDYGTVYYAMVTADIADCTLAWSFETFTTGKMYAQSGGNCNGIDPVTIELPYMSVSIDPVAGEDAVVIVEWTAIIDSMAGFGAPDVDIQWFIFGFNIDAGDPSNLNGTIEFDIGEGLDITTVFYHNDGDAWVEVVAPASWDYSQGVLTIERLNLSSSTDGDIEIVLLDATAPPPYYCFDAVYMEDDECVLLSWTTETEVDVEGFNVIRSATGEQDDAVCANTSIIPATNTPNETRYQYIDPDLAQGEYYYWIEMIQDDGYRMYHGPQTVMVPDNAPEFTVFSGAYPNPFNPETTIAFSLSEPGDVTLDIYNIRGEKVRCLLSEYLDADEYMIPWNGLNDSGNAVASGVYFARLKSDGRTFVRKMLLLK